MTLSTPSLVELVYGAAWPNSAQADEFMNKAETMWGTEDGRALVTRWIDLLGKPSEFVDGPIWSWQQAKTHTDAWGEWHKNDLAEKEAAQAPKRGPGRPRLTSVRNDEADIASKAWHDAIQGRKEALGQARLQRDIAIVVAKQAYDALKIDWDKFVEHQRQAMLSVQKATG